MAPRVPTTRSMIAAGVYQSTDVSMAAVSGRYRRPIVTEITPASEFWRGEDYHQRYLEKRGLAHCTIR